MATITVGAPGTLEWALGVYGFQAWRAAYLVHCNQVKVKRNGALIDLKVDGPATALLRGDELTVDDPPPIPCPGGMSKVPTHQDYALVSIDIGPTDTHIKRLKRFYDERGQTIRLEPPNLALKEFIDMLSQDAKATAPIRDLMIGTHASGSGSIAVRAVAGENAHIQYERLEKAVTDKNLFIKAGVLQPRPKDPKSQADLPPRFVIRGCAVGVAMPFLKKFKEALGSTVEVVAPKYEHAIGDYSGRGGDGLYEFLAYEFELYQPKKLKTDKDIVGAFVAKGLLNYDAKPIDGKTWASWIPIGSPPADFSKHRKYPSTPAKRQITGLAFFNTRHEDFPGPPIVLNLPADPGTETNRKAALRTHLDNEPRFKSDHAWPAYVRLGYKNMNDMMDGFVWSFQYSSTTNKLTCIGKRWTYMVHQPIVEPSGELIHNHFPLRPMGQPTIAFTDKDPRFFATT
jgi:hypothetical protein